MPKKGVGPSTVKKNIEKESSRYSLRHKTIRYIQELADRDERGTGAYLDVLIEREARKHLPAELVQKIVAEAEQKEAERLGQAKGILREREAKDS